MMSLLNKETYYTWHLSLRVDRPIEGCTAQSHAYMYGKKMDDREIDKSNFHHHHSKIAKEAPPPHEFVYRWYRGPEEEICAYDECPRRKSYSPHDWSMHALGGFGSALQCVSGQSSLYRAIFCNSECFVKAWKNQHTVQHQQKDAPQSMSAQKYYNGSNTPQRRTSSSDDDEASTGSYGGLSNSNGSLSYSTNNLSSMLSPTSKGYVPRSTSYNDHFDATTTPGGGGGGGTTTDQEWQEISNNQIYIPTADDIGRKLKLEVGAYSIETGELLMHRVVKTDLVLTKAPGPAKRNLITSKPTGPRGGDTFRIVTYNILAEIYATQQQYPYCDLWALSWEFRFQNILREIKDAGPDVICLQEVQADHYETHVYNALSEKGYEGVYKQKTRASMGMAGKVDGCALFWRRSKFHLVESYSIEFNELAQRQATQVLGMNPRSEECMAYLNRLSKDNVAQLVVLELAQSSRSSRDPINQVCIANTHLYSNKDFPDVKLWQSWQLLQELETFIMSRGTNLPLMICGDFNSTPDTAVYGLLSRQAVHPGHPDVNMNNNDDSTPSILPDAMSISHSFQLGSVYNTVIGKEPHATNYTGIFKGVLDYMWYSAQNLRPLSAAPIPEESVLTKHGEALPSTQYSSDHIMLISDMQIMGGSSMRHNG